ncbi:hypothetical protein Aperf_G00000006543 [Anoplocephala perfoliata]
MALKESSMWTAAALGRLTNLRVLNISGTDFTSEGLQRLVEVLPHLHSLDISKTRIDNISCLRDFIQNHPNLKIFGLAGLDYCGAMGICELSRNHPNLMALLGLMQSRIDDREIISEVIEVIDSLFFFLDEDVHLKFADLIVNTIFACMKPHRNKLGALRNCFFLLFEVISSVAITERILCNNRIIRSLQVFNDEKLRKQGHDMIHLVTFKLSETEKKTVTNDSECLEWLLTVIMKLLPRSPLMTLRAFSNDYLPSYIPVANSNPNFVPDHCRQLERMLDILYLLIAGNSDACQAFSELGGIIIVAGVIQVCPDNVKNLCVRILNGCRHLQLIILYVASSSLEALCNSRWPLEISPQDLSITADEFGVLHCGPFALPRVFSSFYNAPPPNSKDSNVNEQVLPNIPSCQAT